MVSAEYVARRMAAWAAWLADLKANVPDEHRGLLAMVGSPPDRRGLLTQGAWERCEFCGRCGRELAADEPVRIKGAYYGGDGVRTPTCAECRPGYERDDDFHPPRPCDGCGRMVAVLIRRGPPRKVIVCSRRCEWTARNRRRAAIRRRLNRRVCQACGETFTPPRSDARYCSSACRQRAYRQRS